MSGRHFDRRSAEAGRRAPRRHRARRRLPRRRGVRHRPSGADPADREQAMSDRPNTRTGQMTEAYPSEKGVPIPKSTFGGSNPKYSWRTMEVDDSFFVTGGKLNNMLSLAGGANHRFAPKRFTSRTVTEDG